MAQYKKFRTPTLDAVAAACTVYRLMGNTVKKAELNDTSKTSKDMLLDHFSGVCLLDITPADHARAQEVIDYVRQRNMMDTLAGRSNSPFFLSVAALLEKDTTSSSDFGILAWAPKLADDLSKTDDRTQEIRQALHDSRYIGVPGRGIELEFHTLSNKLIRESNRFVVLGHDATGNAVSFWTNSRVSGIVNIKARVKAHDQLTRYGNLPCTLLHYVKFKK
jgi:hypothetical protein